MLVLDNILFSIGGQNVTLLECLSVLLGLSCVFFAVRGKVANFWIGYFYNIFLFFMFLNKHLYSSMLLQPISFGINVFGHYRWTHPSSNERDKKNELKVTLLSWRQRVLLLLIVAVFTVAWGFFLSKINDLWPNYFPEARQPFLDAFVTAFLLLAQYLSAQKKIDCWGAWFVVNITNGILYIKVGLVFLPVVCAAYLVLAFFGFGMWRNKMIEEKNIKIENK